MHCALLVVLIGACTPILCRCTGLRHRRPARRHCRRRQLPRNPGRVTSFWLRRGRVYAHRVSQRERARGRARRQGPARAAVERRRVARPVRQGTVTSTAPLINSFPFLNRVVRYALLSFKCPYAHRVLIGACNPMGSPS